MILVTGGTGLLGTHLLYDLVSKGKNVRALKRSTSNINQVKEVFAHYSNKSEDLFNKIEWIDGDILDIPSLEEAFIGITKVYHCAALVSFVKKDYHKLMKINVEGTANISNLCLDNNIEKLCYVSSTAAIGKPIKNKIVTEDEAWNREVGNSNYSKSKFLAEREVWRAQEEGLNMVIVNPCVILGPGNIDDSSNTIFKNAKYGMKFYTDGMNAFVDVRDITKAMTTLMDSDINGERFLVTGENLFFKDLFTKCCNAFGTKTPTKKASKFMTGIAWRFEALRTKITGGKPKITKENTVSAHTVVKYSSEKLKRELDFNFTSIDDAIANAVKFYKN